MVHWHVDQCRHLCLQDQRSTAPAPHCAYASLRLTAPMPHYASLSLRLSTPHCAYASLRPRSLRPLYAIVGVNAEAKEYATDVALDDVSHHVSDYSPGIDHFSLDET